MNGVRARRLRLEPLCRFCKKEGRVTIASVVDHIKPHKGNEALFFDLANTQSLCESHHNKDKQALERGGHVVGTDGWPVESELVTKKYFSSVGAT